MCATCLDEIRPSLEDIICVRKNETSLQMHVDHNRIQARGGHLHRNTYRGVPLRALKSYHPNTKIRRKLGPIQIPNVKKIRTRTFYKYYTECKMYLQWDISLGAYHTNRLNQEILCWKKELVHHLGKIRTHWHTKAAKIRTH